MNERIEQLTEQCWVHTEVPLFGAKSPHWEFDRQKFAELIVKECMDVVSKKCASPTAYKALVEHFGVEE